MELENAPPGAVGVINVLDALCIVMCRRGKGTSPQALRTSFPNLISNMVLPKVPDEDVWDEGG